LAFSSSPNLQNNDGRAVPGASLKISFVKIPTDKLTDLKKLIKENTNGSAWLNLEGTK